MCISTHDLRQAQTHLSPLSCVRDKTMWQKKKKLKREFVDVSARSIYPLSTPSKIAETESTGCNYTKASARWKKQQLCFMLRKIK